MVKVTLKWESAVEQRIFALQSEAIAYACDVKEFCMDNNKQIPEVIYDEVDEKDVLYQVYIATETVPKAYVGVYMKLDAAEDIMEYYRKKGYPACYEIVEMSQGGNNGL